MRTHGKTSTYSSGCRCDACTAASREYMRGYRSARAEEIRATGKAYYEEHKEEQRERRRNHKKAYGPSHRDEARAAELKRVYGLSKDGFDALLGAQEYRCKICGADNPGRAKTDHFCVDHDHATGMVRGLLCHRCNVVLGLIHDSEQTALNMAVYIREFHVTA